MDAAPFPAEAPAAEPHAGTARRYLIAAAVTDVLDHPEAERAELAEDVRRMEDLFLGELGYHRGARLGLNPTRPQLLSALREFATAADRRADDHVVLYLAAHGATDPDSGRHYLLLHDSRARDLYGTALPTEDLVGQLWEGTAVERLLVLIDACYAEEGTDRALRGALDARRFRAPVTEHGNSGLVLVSASRRKEEAFTGALSAAFDRAVRRQATAGHAPAHISLEQVMAAISADPEVPLAQRPVWSLTHATGDIPAFLPNPRYIPGSAGLKLDEIDRIVAVRARERDAREQDMRDFFLPRARGTDLPTEEVWDFTGRHMALGDVTTWLDPRRADERLCVVTGDPGSGKSSVLGMVAVLTDPERSAAVPREELPPLLPRPGDVDVRVNASHLSTRQLLDALSAAAGCAAESLGALTAHLQTRSTPLVVLVDSLDEALVPHETVDELVAPLTDPERRLPLRLLVGARPHIAARLPADAPRIDLDSERHGDPGAVRAYTRKLLCAPGSPLRTAQPRLVDTIAEAVAEAAGRSFLVARITARTLAREPHPPDPYDQGWRDALPRLPGQAMERDLVQRLGPRAVRARELLLPLAYAQGAGLPWAGIWPRLACALTGRDYGDEDVVWLRQAAGSYVVESVEAGGSVYRVYHRALIEYLREGRDAEAVQRTVTEVLREVEHPYVRRYLALHAAEGGVLDPLVQDAAFVLRAEPGRLLAALPGLRTREGRRAGQAVRDLEGELRDREGRGPDPQARARLRLAAVCHKAQTLADSCDAGEELPWRARWAAWNPHEGERQYDGMSIGVGRGVVVPRADGARFLDLTRRNGAVWVDLDGGGVTRARPSEVTWYLRTLDSVPQLRDGAAAMYSDPRLSLEKGRVEHRPWARLLHVWQATGLRTWLLPPSPVDTDAEREVLDVPHRTVVLAGANGAPRTVALLFLAGRLTGHVIVYRLNSAFAYPPLGRRQRRDLWNWEREDWQKRADQLTADCELVLSPEETGHRVSACAAPLGLPTGSLLLAHEDGRVVQFSIPTQMTEAEAVTGHEDPITEVVTVDGHPLGRLVVTAGLDRTVRLSSLTTGAPVRTLLKTGSVIASLAVHRVARQWIVAVVTSDGQLHRVDLDSGRPIGLPLRVDRGLSVRATTFDLGLTACVSVQGGTRGVQLYDLVTGDRLGGQVLNHGVTTLCRAGGTVCAGGTDGIVRLWPTPHAADSTHLIAHDSQVLAVGEIRGPSGTPALVTVGQDREIRCWDLARRHELWRRRLAVDPGVWEDPLISCAVVGETSDGRAFLATGEYRGRVEILVLRAGMPVAEQGFTVPDTVLTLTTGRVRGRDVLVAGTGTGRIVCWDVGAGRMYAYGPSPDTEVWTTALALAPDGSGRLAVGGLDGSVREWSLPTCRPLGPARAAHRGAVRALEYTATGLVGCGLDNRLAVYDDGWERRMPVPVASLHRTDDGLLCGDDRGHIWSLRDGPEGRRVVEALDAVRPVTAVAAVPVDGELVVVSGGGDGSLQVREAEHGTPVRNLRPVDETEVEQLATVSRRSPGRPPVARLFARGGQRVLQYWDFGMGGPLSSAGTPLLLTVPHDRSGARLAVLPEDDGQTLLSLTIDEALGDLDVHDVFRGRLAHQRCAVEVDDAPSPAWLRAVRCAGRVLVFTPVDSEVLAVLDTSSRRWATVRMPDPWLLDVFTLPGPDGDTLLLIAGDRTRIVSWEALRTRFKGHDEWPRTYRQLRFRGRRYGRAAPGLPVVHEHRTPLSLPDFCALLPGSESYALTDGPRLAVVRTRTGEVLRDLVLPSPCTALTTGPRGELVVGTDKGLILFD
ncbi:caspase family protein [Streptomyces sp. NPDC096132]|uniref:caspase family protein n=1 Tax=Streptomyces sp. NPDC096132 TaxID=3366075 RepID=UPI003802A78F